MRRKLHRLTLSIFLIIQVYCDDVIYYNETGRYVYQGPNGLEYCRYCPYGSNNPNNYNNKCRYKTKNLYDNLDDEEKKEQLYPWCHTGTIPACSPLPMVKNGTWTCEDRVNPQHTFPGIPGRNVNVYTTCSLNCTMGFNVQGDDTYYCLESRKWSGNLSDAICVLSPSGNDKKAENHVGLILRLVFGGVVVIIIIVVILLIHNLCCKKKCRSSVPKGNDPEASQFSSVETVGRKGSTKSFSTGKDSGTGTYDETDSLQEQRPLIEGAVSYSANPEACEISMMKVSTYCPGKTFSRHCDAGQQGEPLTGNQEDHNPPQMTNVGDSNPPKMNVVQEYKCCEDCEEEITIKTQKMNFTPKSEEPYIVPEGMTVYIVSKGTAGNGKGISVETFVLEKVTNEDRSSQRLSKMFEFMYLIKDLCIEDSGKYEYTITLACGHTKTGTITISVVALSTGGPGEDKAPDAMATPDTGPLCVNIPPVDSMGAEMCSLTLSDSEDMLGGIELHTQLGYYLDPTEHVCWQHLARKFLKMNTALLKCIEWHYKGNINDGPTRFILEQMKHHDFRIGDLVWFFCQHWTERRDVVEIIKKYHQCGFCDQYYPTVR